MASNKKLSLSDRFGIMKPSKTAIKEDTCETADSFRDEYMRIIMTRHPSTHCVTSSTLITSDEELDFKMKDGWKEHFEMCLKGNTWSEKEHRNSATNDNDDKTDRTEFKEQHGYWIENCCQTQPLDQFKAVEKVGISFKTRKPEEIERSDIVATEVFENLEGKNQNKGKMQEYSKIISKSKPCVVETKQVKDRKDETIVSFSSLPKRRRLLDKGSEGSYISSLDNIYETKLAEKSSVYGQIEKLIVDHRPRFTNALLKQPRFYPCQNTGFTNQGNISRNGFEQEASQSVSPFLNNPLTSDISNFRQENVTSTQESSNNLMERDLGIIMCSPSAFSSSETANYHSTLSHGYTSYSQDNISELDLLERTLNVPSGFYASKICKNTYKAPEISQSLEQSFIAMVPRFYIERDLGQSEYRENSFEGSPGKKELFQTLLQQCSALVHTVEDQKALEAVISLVSQQASGSLDMNQDTRNSNAVTAMMGKVQQARGSLDMNQDTRNSNAVTSTMDKVKQARGSLDMNQDARNSNAVTAMMGMVQQTEKDIVAESCHSTTIDDSTEIGSNPEEGLSSFYKTGELFEGRTLLKGGVKPRHIPKTYIPKSNREPPFDPRRRLDIDKKIIISLPFPKFCVEISKFKMAEELNASFKPKKSELLEISCSPNNKSIDGEGSFSNCIVHDDGRISCKSLVKDTPTVQGTPVKTERCDKDLYNQMTINRIYGKLNLNKSGSTNVKNKFLSEMETTANMKDIILTSLRDQATTGLEEAKVEELEKLHIKKDSSLEIAHSTNDQIIKSEKIVSNTNENMQLPTFNKEYMKTTETSVAEVVKTLEASIVHTSKNKHMEHAILTNASCGTLRANISNTAVNLHESEKTTHSNVKDACTVRKPLITFKLKKSLGHSNETSLSTQVQCDAIPTKKEATGSDHASNSKEDIKEKLNPEVQTSVDLSMGQQFCDQSDFQKCELYDPSSPTETIVEEVSMELDSSMEEREIQLFLMSDMNISSDAAETGIEKGCKDLEIVRSNWKETFCTIEREKEGKDSSDEFGLRKTLLESRKKDTEDLGGSIIGSDKLCGTNMSQAPKELSSSDQSCCDSHDSRSRGRCKTLQPIKKGLNDCEDSHRKSCLCKRSGSRSHSYSRVQDSLVQPKSKGSDQIKDRHRRSGSRSKSSTDYKDSHSRDRWHRSYSMKKYDRDGHLPSKCEYSRNCSWSRSHCCQSRSVRDYNRSSEKSPSDYSPK